jgi:HPt (histidine-containing phosphotransfer) domain-containing protein
MARIEGDSALLLELVKMFRESYPPLMRSVHQAIERKDSSAMEVAGHALRGSLANLGAKHASTMAGELEAIGRTGDLSGAESSATRLQDELILVAAALDSSCREASIENSRR